MFNTMMFNKEEKSRYSNVTDKIILIDPVTKKEKETLATRAINRREESEGYFHTIGYREDLFDIADRYYGDSSLWWVIADANISINDPYKLEYNSVIKIPRFNPREY